MGRPGRHRIVMRGSAGGGEPIAGERRHAGVQECRKAHVPPSGVFQFAGDGGEGNVGLCCLYCGVGMMWKVVCCNFCAPQHD